MDLRCPPVGYYAFEKFTETSQIVEHCNLDICMHTHPDNAIIRKKIIFPCLVEK